MSEDPPGAGALTASPCGVASAGGAGGASVGIVGRSAGPSDGADGAALRERSSTVELDGRRFDVKPPSVFSPIARKLLDVVRTLALIVSAGLGCNR